jgi:trehalose 6-phosphate phosphatase
MLGALHDRLEGRLAVISGRSVDQIDTILGPVARGLAVAGSHGLEFRWDGEIARPQRPDELDIAAARLRPYVEDHPGLLLEEKTLGVALHYRMKPWMERRAQALARQLADELALCLQPGKMMVELRPAGGDKGTAVERLMGHAPMTGTIPVFAGDDLTDEPGFAAARRLGGHGILVGPARPTAADHVLPSPAALREWFRDVLA